MNIATTGLRPLALMTTIMVIAVAGGLIIATNGESDDKKMAVAPGPDLAFVNDMADHHVSAIGLARIARRRGDSPFIRDFAAEMVKDHAGEVGALTAVRRRLIEAGFERSEITVAKRLRGIDIGTRRLERARRFNRAFVDAMLTHQRGGIRLARVQVANGRHEPLVRLARTMIARSSRQISALSQYRLEAFGR